jgi:hypothetical protein
MSRALARERAARAAQVRLGQAVDQPNGAPKHHHDAQQKMARYLERFATVFERDFFVRKAFNKLNPEKKLCGSPLGPREGFRKACEVLYQVYRREQGKAWDSFLPILLHRPHVHRPPRLRH